MKVLIKKNIISFITHISLGLLKFNHMSKKGKFGFLQDLNNKNDTNKYLNRITERKCMKKK